MSIAHLEVSQQRPHQLGLPVLVIAERGVELVDRLLRHEGAEELHHRARAFQLHVEIRAGKGKDDAHFIRRRQDRIDLDPVVAVDQRKDQRQIGPSGPQPADQIRALVAIERDRDHFDGVERHFAGLASQLLRERLSSQAGVELEVAKERREGEVLQELLDRRLDPAAHRVGSQHLLDGSRRQRAEIGVFEVDARSRPRGAHQLASHRIEEGECQLRVRLLSGNARVPGAQLLPELVVAVRWTQRSLQVPHHPVHELAIQREPLHRILLAPAPVPSGRSAPRPGGSPGRTGPGTRHRPRGSPRRFPPRHRGGKWCQGWNRRGRGRQGAWLYIGGSGRWSIGDRSMVDGRWSIVMSLGSWVMGRGSLGFQRFTSHVSRLTSSVLSPQSSVLPLVPSP